MSTTLRSELSHNNEYWIPKHRYYELKHFCLQYHDWQKALTELDGMAKYSPNSIRVDTSGHSDPTEKNAIERLRYSEKIEMLEGVARETDEVLAPYILLGVTKGISYDVIKVRLEIPCGKDIYYTLYRRFFWLLDKKRG